MKRFRMIFITVVMVLLLFSSVVHALTWKASKRLTNNAGDSNFPAVAVDGSNIYVVWSDGTPGNFEIYFKRSFDGGVTWKPAERLTNNAGNSENPAIVVDGLNIYVVWGNYTTGGSEIYFKRSVDGGVTWKTDKSLTKGGCYAPTIAVEGSNIYVVWMDGSSGNYFIYCKRSLDRGVTWKTDKRLTNTAGSSLSPAIAVDGSNIYVVWYDTTSGNAEIYFKRSVDRGVTWKTSKRLTNNENTSWDPAIAVDGLNIYVMWYQYTPGNFEIYFKRSVDRGVTWKTSKRLTNNPGGSSSPAISVDNDNIYAVWEDGTPGNYEIYFRRSLDGGISWTADKRLTNNAGCSYVPAIAVDGSNIYVVWSDGTPGNYEINFKKGVLN
jgi:hypothetical protein